MCPIHFPVIGSAQAIVGDIFRERLFEHTKRSDEMPAKFWIVETFSEFFHLDQTGGSTSIPVQNLRIARAQMGSVLREERQQRSDAGEFHSLFANGELHATVLPMFIDQVGEEKSHACSSSTQATFGDHRSMLGGIEQSVGQAWTFFSLQSPV